MQVDFLHVLWIYSLKVLHAFWTTADWFGLSENSNANSLKYVTIMKQTKHNSYYGPGK